jgi:hypothetical protein
MGSRCGRQVSIARLHQLRATGVLAKQAIAAKDAIASEDDSGDLLAADGLRHLAAFIEKLDSPGAQ